MTQHQGTRGVGIEFCLNTWEKQLVVINIRR